MPDECMRSRKVKSQWPSASTALKSVWEDITLYGKKNEKPYRNTYSITLSRQPNMSSISMRSQLP